MFFASLVANGVRGRFPKTASTETGELGLSISWDLFAGSRLALAAVAVLLCFWFCSLDAAGLRLFCFHFILLRSDADGVRLASGRALSSLPFSLC